MSQVGRKLIVNKLINYRIKANLTREQLSLMIGRDNSYISKLENLKINISIDRLEEIANHLGMGIEEFIKP